jgi:hypothetical protein
MFHQHPTSLLAPTRGDDRRGPPTPDTNDTEDVFVCDLATATTTPVSNGWTHLRLISTSCLSAPEAARAQAIMGSSLLWRG